MSELMEHGGSLVKGKKRRLAGRRLGEIAHIDDNRSYVLPVFRDILVAEIVHPCPASLGRTRVIVGKQDADKGAVGIRNLESFHIGMIDRDAFEFLEIESVESVGRSKDALTDILHLEIRLDEGFVELVVPVAHSLGVIGPVPRTDYRSAVVRKDSGLDIGIHDFLHHCHFLFSPGHGRGKDSAEESVDCRGVVGHLVRKYEIRRGVIPQEPGLLYPQPDYFQYDGIVVLRIAAAAP